MLLMMMCNSYDHHYYTPLQYLASALHFHSLRLTILYAALQSRMHPTVMRCTAQPFTALHRSTWPGKAAPRRVMPCSTIFQRTRARQFTSKQQCFAFRGSWVRTCGSRHRTVPGSFAHPPGCAPAISSRRSTKTTAEPGGRNPASRRSQTPPGFLRAPECSARRFHSVPRRESSPRRRKQPGSGPPPLLPRYGDWSDTDLVRACDRTVACERRASLRWSCSQTAGREISSRRHMPIPATSIARLRIRVSTSWPLCRSI